MEEESIYLQSDLEARIELALSAYDAADAHRYDGRQDPNFGPEGSQFCGLLSEYLGDMRSMEWEESARFDTSTDLYDIAFKHYPSFAPLLDGEEICIIEDEDGEY